MFLSLIGVFVWGLTVKMEEKVKEVMQNNGMEQIER